MTSYVGFSVSWRNLCSLFRVQGLTENIGASSIFSGEEEVFAFARACSRLVQMGSKDWAETSGRH